MGVSRRCVHLWLGRYRAGGWAGLEDRSSRPRSCPHATSTEVVADVLARRTEHREGPADLAEQCGVSARTVSRILARAGMPRLRDLDPVTGARIRASWATGRRYERGAPGDMVYADVKKLGRIPDRAAGGQALSNPSAKMHQATHGSVLTTFTWPSMTRPVWRTPRSCLTRRARPAPGSTPGPRAAMAASGAPVKRVMTDNAFA